MAALPRRQLYHCGFVGDTAAGDGDLVVLQPRPVSGFPSDQQVAQLVPGGWGRACAVVVGDPPRLYSWGIRSEKPAADADTGAYYVQGSCRPCARAPAAGGMPAVCANAVPARSHTRLH